MTKDTQTHTPLRIVCYYRYTHTYTHITPKDNVWPQTHTHTYLSHRAWKAIFNHIATICLSGSPDNKDGLSSVTYPD